MSNTDDADNVRQDPDPVARTPPLERQPPADVPDHTTHQPAHPHLLALAELIFGSAPVFRRFLVLIWGTLALIVGTIVLLPHVGVNPSTSVSFGARMVLVALAGQLIRVYILKLHDRLTTKRHTKERRPPKAG